VVYWSIRLQNQNMLGPKTSLWQVTLCILDFDGRISEQPNAAAFHDVVTNFLQFCWPLEYLLILETTGRSSSAVKCGELLRWGQTQSGVAKSLKSDAKEDTDVQTLWKFCSKSTSSPVLTKTERSEIRTSVPGEDVNVSMTPSSIGLVNSFTGSFASLSKSSEIFTL
jgi:hypothetical protein